MDWTDRLRLRQLLVLRSLSQTRNISLSAKQLHMTQPALSKWLKEFEADIGLSLFERHARGLRPTSYGKTLQIFADRICGEMDRARDEMTALREGCSGRVVIGASGAAIASVVPQAIQAVLNAMPTASIEIREAPMDGLFQQLAQHEIDIAIGRVSSRYEGPEIAHELLYEDRLRFAARPKHALLRRRNPSMQDLLAHRWVVWTRDIPARRVLEASLAAVGLEVPRDAVQSNSLLAAIGLILDSDMIAVVAERAIDLPGTTRVLRALPVALQTRSAVGMYWRKELVPSSAASLLLDALRSATRFVPRQASSGA